MATPDYYTNLNYEYTTVGTTSVVPWGYQGTGTYFEPSHGDCIKVDKGTPDKAKFVIFYAVNKKDPMIFCKTEAEKNRELKKLMERDDVDQESIRIFNLSGGIKKKK